MSFSNRRRGRGGGRQAFAHETPSMSVPASVEELLQLIRKSGMVEESKMSEYLLRRQVGQGGLPVGPREAADAMIADGLITNFQAEQFLLGKWRGFTIGKYKLLERVGIGGMGQVFLCEHLFMKRRVAVKVLPPAKAEQPAALGRFYREARAAGSLEHPNIVRTHDIDQDGNLHFIVMEYVDGTNLLDMVKKFGPMDIRRATHYIRQVAFGLDFAFRSGIIHRDIKPGNILIDRKGTAKLLDMGLARFYRDQTDILTVKYDDKIVLGTADYVAPEQVANSHSVDVRADIYALGASFYFLLAGHPPFPTGTVSQKLLWHRTKDPTPIRQVRPEVPEGLAAIVAKMMQKEPANRFQTPAEVAAELERWVPAHIAAPTLDEMPTLSVAARDTAKEVEMLEEEPVNLTASQSIAAVTGSKSRVAVSPFGPENTPESAAPTATAILPSSRTPAVARSILTQSGFGPSPFGPAFDATPSPGYIPAGGYTPTPTKGLPGLPAAGGAPENHGQFPVIAMPPMDTKSEGMKKLAIAAVAAAVLLAGGLFVYKFFIEKKPAPQPDAAARP